MPRPDIMEEQQPDEAETTDNPSEESADKTYTVPKESLGDVKVGETLTVTSMDDDTVTLTCNEPEAEAGGSDDMASEVGKQNPPDEAMGGY